MSKLQNQDDDDDYEEKRKARIRAIVMGTYNMHKCDLCGFPNYKGGIHPFAGVHAKRKSEQRWCHGSEKLRERWRHIQSAKGR